MPLVWTGILTAPLDRARKLLARSLTWQAAVGAADETEALNSIHLEEASYRTEMPYGIIGMTHWSGNVAAGGSQFVMQPSGGISLMLCFEADDSYTFIADKVLSFLNTLESIVVEMNSLLGVDDNLSADSCHIEYMMVGEDDTESSGGDVGGFVAQITYGWDRTG